MCVSLSFRRTPREKIIHVKASQSVSVSISISVSISRPYVCVRRASLTESQKACLPAAKHTRGKQAGGVAVHVAPPLAPLPRSRVSVHPPSLDPVLHVLQLFQEHVRVRRVYRLHLSERLYVCQRRGAKVEWRLFRNTLEDLT